MEPESFGFNLLYTFFPEPLFLLAMSGEVAISIILILVLLCCSALVSGSEVAYFSLTHNDEEELKKESEDSLASQRVLKLLKDPAYLLATILIANNFINIGIIVLSTIATAPLEIFFSSGTSFISSLTSGCNSILGCIDEQTTEQAVGHFIIFLITVVTVTFFLVLFGEVSPKVYAKLNSMKLAKFMSKIMLVLKWLFYPMSSILVNSSTFLEGKLASKAMVNKLSALEIDQAIQLTVSREKNSEREVDILRSIINFNNISVKQIMRSRLDVKALDFNLDFKEVLKLVRKLGYSRVPVFDEDFDNIIGILHVKDILGYLREKDDFEWQELIRTQVMYIPESKKISDLLNEFQEKRTHMAIVVDEYGGSSGIVTLEDVMEEVIGEIQDEFDAQREIDYQKINAFTYVFEGKIMLHDISKLLDIDMDVFEEVRGEADSLAGLLLEMYGFIPPNGKSITYKKYTFEVVASTKKRIEKIKLVLPH
ncbi:MAG: putative hemolysin [Maribacter sp.]